MADFKRSLSHPKDIFQFENFKNAIVGFVDSPRFAPICCYEAQVIFQELISTLGEGTELNEAEEFFNYNIADAHYGDDTPIFVDSDSYFNFLLQELLDEEAESDTKELDSYTEEQELNLLPNYLECAVNIGERCGFPSSVVYDANKIIECIKSKGLKAEESLDHFKYQIWDNCTSENDPVFLWNLEK